MELDEVLKSFWVVYQRHWCFLPEIKYAWIEVFAKFHSVLSAAMLPLNLLPFNRAVVYLAYFSQAYGGHYNCIIITTFNYMTAFLLGQFSSATFMQRA